METKKITIRNNPVLSVGGAYYVEYTIDDKDYSVGDIIDASIKEVRGGESRKFNASLKVDKAIIDALNTKREEKKREGYIQSLRRFNKLYLLQLYCYYLNSDSDSPSLYGSVCETIERGGSYDIWDENDDLDIDKEREVIYSMTEEEFASNSKYSYIEYFESFFDNLREKIEEMGEDDEDLKELERVIDEMPSLYLILNEDEIQKYRRANGDIFIDGFEYIIRDIF